MHTTQCPRHLESPRWSVLQRNSATILSMSFLCIKKVKKFFTYACFCFCLCVMFVPHQCSLYLYAVCDCASIFGQYSDIDLSNAGHSLLPWILMMFLCVLQRQTLQVNKNIWVRNQNFGRCLLGGGGTG